MVCGLLSILIVAIRATAMGAIQELKRCVDRMMTKKHLELSLVAGSLAYLRNAKELGL
jgi:hypothetical protein